ncbi:uncharacterized protein LOC115440598 [Manduca sexta]|uniref:RRM domain-containing protein n=1 Tax=Manduca sexta TaxID=7130 RepID=A0A922CH34_MANSE|nr:uncharacterized protein LOC115440598 [Manduca sexta]KAG6445684.1 hypothetical protein O3G_MSEX004067 [Manduca sexta]
MIEEDNKTLWCGNLSDQVNEELLYELFLQAGPLEKVRIARDKDGRQKNFAFITYCHEVSVPYALNLFRGTALFQRTLSLQCRARMALLPPRIRCYGPDATPDFLTQGNANVTQQFAQMTDHLKQDDLHSVHEPRRSDIEDVKLSSLQGNWSHRHHPYRGKDKSYGRDDFRPRGSHSDKTGGHSKHSSSWRDKKSHKKGSYHRRN